MRRTISPSVVISVSLLLACDPAERDAKRTESLPSQPGAKATDSTSSEEAEDVPEPEDEDEDEPEPEPDESVDAGSEAAASDLDSAAAADAGAEQAGDASRAAELDASAPSPDASGRDSADVGPDVTLMDAQAALDAGGRDALDLSDAAALDAHADAGAYADADAHADTDAALPPEPPRECSEQAQAACPNSGYPCIASDDGAGYQCRGQYAAWPIAEKKVGAKAVPKFTVRAADDVVLDEVTGLLWQRSSPATFSGCSGALTKNVPGSGCSWEEAQQYCAGLTLAGRSWRLPSKIELESLLDFVSAPAQQLLDPVAFPGADPGFYWTSSESAILGPDYAFELWFQVGTSFHTGKQESSQVRCVHSERVVSAPPGERYRVDEAADTVFDRFTRLEWQRHPSEADVSVDSAEQYCADAGFRLPRLKELKSLFDPIATPFSIDLQAFPPYPLGWWLLSDTRSPLGTLVVNPFGGSELSDVFLAQTPLYTEPGPLQASLHVRCVR